MKHFIFFLALVTTLELKKDLSLYIKNCELQIEEEALYRARLYNPRKIQITILRKIQIIILGNYKINIII